MATVAEKPATEEIELKNVGPIARLSIPYLPAGGVVVLRGPNGAGKSIALDALEAAATKKGRPPVKDRELHGEVRAFGVEMKIGRRATITGEPVVTSMESEISVGHLVDPQIASPEAADAKRIKALVRLAGVQPDPSLFYELLGGRTEFESIVRSDIGDLGDVVIIADRIKRDCDTAAKAAENKAEHAEGRAKASREASLGVDLAGECDAVALGERHTKATEALTRQRAKNQQATQHNEKIEDAQAALDRLTAGYTGPTVDEAQAAEAKAECLRIFAMQAVDTAEKALAQAKADFRDAKADHDIAFEKRRAAESHAATMAAFQEQVSKLPLALASDEELAILQKGVDEAREALERGALIRKAKDEAAKSEAAQQEALDHRKRAEQLRQYGKGTDEVLSQIVAKLNTPLRVEAGRLVLETPERGKTFFAELSDGQRWKMVLDIAADAMGDTRGMIAIPQWAWSELQPANKKAIADHLRRRGICGYTAEATDGEELTAEVYQ